MTTAREPLVSQPPDGAVTGQHCGYLGCLRVTHAGGDGRCEQHLGPAADYVDRDPDAQAVHDRHDGIRQPSLPIPPPPATPVPGNDPVTNGPTR